MRPSWDEYFMQIVDIVKMRSTCLRKHVGAVIVKDMHIISTGYNGAPSGLKHCEETGCMREKLKIPSGERHELCRGIHAEQNAIIQAALNGVSTKDATIYVNVCPCSLCAKMLINAGIKRIVYQEGYPDELSMEFIKEAGLDIVKIER
ncbi:cytidine/deoxycytidylate deaminase family protein [Aceticella autotrophica]|uniref:Cytidine/deoxycytidylate deaminase family protein n=1 Tax=Aceticella autotrophica TaxID=2755338 RepID=A0A975AV54_9THEO|nr:cytidine/deoxycytidylate deaminase family protein [Aceticella autotrophica]QSZ27035.1 cytidine/deoxycytidylate deaminase family protein [Aceticella autotrophica]